MGIQKSIKCNFFKSTNFQFWKLKSMCTVSFCQLFSAIKGGIFARKKLQQPILGQILIFFHFYDCAIANASLLSRNFSGFFKLRQSFRAASTITIFHSSGEKIWLIYMVAMAFWINIYGCQLCILVGFTELQSCRSQL